MTRALLVLSGKPQREMAKRWVEKLPVNTRVEFKAPRRTLPQNDRMWAHLTDIARQVRYHGQKLTPEDFKILFMAALSQEVRWVPNLDGTGMVLLGRSSSDLSREEMGALIDLIEEWAARNGVQLGDQSTSSEGPARETTPAGVAA